MVFVASNIKHVVIIKVEMNQFVNQLSLQVIIKNAKSRIQNVQKYPKNAMNMIQMEVFLVLHYMEEVH